MPLKKYVPQPLDYLLMLDGRMSCNGCDALTPPDQLYAPCYCIDCATEVAEAEAHDANFDKE